MTDLPPDLAAFASLLDAQPAPVRGTPSTTACACLMVEAGKMRLVETVPGEGGAVSVFETVAGDRFSGGGDLGKWIGEKTSADVGLPWAGIVCEDVVRPAAPYRQPE